MKKNMMNKLFCITEENVNYLKRIQEEYPHIKSDSAALRFLFTDYERLLRQTEDLQKVKMMLSIQKEMEKKINRIYDSINTMLITNSVDTCIPASYMESQVYTKSREYEKEKLAQLKQEKDYKNRKGK